MTPTETDLLSICCACTSTNGIFNVRCFGAKGDDAVDDLGAILAARNAVNAAGGGVLFFPGGRFVVSDTIELGASTTVLGLGAQLGASGEARRRLLQHAARAELRRRARPRSRARRKPRQDQPPDDPDNENIGCGFLGPGRRGPDRSVHPECHRSQPPRSGIRIIGPHNSDDPYKLERERSSR